MPHIASGWIAADLPPNEEKRLAALHNHQVDFFTSESSFDHITRLAAQLFDTPISLISLIDETHQRFKSHHGLVACATPRDMSFCAHAVMAGANLIIPDATQDDRFRSNPLVVGEPHIRFYAGALLTDKNGFHLGTLNIIDTKPRHDFSPDKIAALEGLAHIAMDSITLRSRYSNEIAQKKVLDNIFDQIPLGIFVKNAKDNFRYYFVNKHANQLFELEDDAIIGLTDFDIFRAAEAECFRTTDQSVMREHHVLQIETETVTTRRGTWIARTHKIPIYDENGDPFLLLGLFEDITEHIKQKQRLEEATNAAQEANQAKSEFLANMSHEIRTPLNGVLATTELLAETPLNATQSKYVSMIQSSGSLLHGLISDILDYSKIEARMLELSNQVFDLYRVMELTFQLFEVQAGKKGIALHTNIHPNVPRWIVGDPHRLKQIVVNLLSNALKYTSHGHVGISIEVGHSLDQPHLFFSITDSGRGIAEDNQKIIFEKFTQVHKTESINGTGLGLTICQSLVHLMKGKIGVISQEGLGSTFWFHVPLQQPREQPPITEQQQSANRLTYSYATLVVEDNETNRFVLCSLLESMGCRVVGVENGKEAISAVQGNYFDIIFMDCNMPVMDGYDATRSLRNDCHLRTPIIGISAHIFAHEVHSCIAAGMNDFLPKPIKKEDLINVMKRWLNPVDNHGLLLSNTPSLLSRTASATGKFDNSALTLLRQDMPERFIPIINIAVANAADLYQKIIEARHHGNFQELTRHAHALKSVSSQLGGVSLSTLCAQLETYSLINSEEEKTNIFKRFELAYSQFHSILRKILTCPQH